MIKSTIKTFLGFLLLSFAISAFAQQGSVGLGDPRESVLDRWGVPAEVKEIRVKEKVFITYYYRKIDVSFVIDKNFNIVCEMALGKTVGVCYPCEYGPGVGTCP